MSEKWNEEMQASAEAVCKLAPQEMGGMSFSPGFHDKNFKVTYNGFPVAEFFVRITPGGKFMHNEHGKFYMIALDALPAALDRISALEAQVKARDAALAKSCCDACGGLGEEPQEVEEKMCKQCNGTGHVSP